MQEIRYILRIFPYLPPGHRPFRAGLDRWSHSGGCRCRSHGPSCPLREWDGHHDGSNFQEPHVLLKNFGRRNSGGFLGMPMKTGRLWGSKTKLDECLRNVNLDLLHRTWRLFFSDCNKPTAKGSFSMVWVHQIELIPVKDPKRCGSFGRNHSCDKSTKLRGSRASKPTWCRHMAVLYKDRALLKPGFWAFRLSVSADFASSRPIAVVFSQEASRSV